MAIEELEPGRLRDDAIVSVAQRWTQQEPAETAAWLTTLEEGDLRSEAVHNLVKLLVAIYEMLKMNSAIREMTFNREPAQAIRRQSRLLGMRTLLEDGVSKACSGLTTLEEVLSICHHAHE